MSWPSSLEVPDQTPETYLGSARAHNYAGAGGSGTYTFAYPPTVPDDEWALTGTWSVGPEALAAG